jgi:hypothetical protein
MEPPAAGTVSLPIREVLRIANEYERGGRLEDATRLLNHILRVAPDQGDALHLAGIVAFRRGDVAKSLHLMERSLVHGIDTPLYLRNICEVYRAAGRPDEALDAARRATALAPADPLCLHNQAVIHYHRVELDAALDCAGRALRIDPSLPGGHFVRAEALLLRGEWAEGWDEYEWRFRIGGAAPLMPPTGKSQWDGGALSDRTLLLIAIAGSVEMRPLVQQIAPGVPQFVRWQDVPDYGAYCALSSLPRLAGTRVETVPAPIPYLRANQARTAQWAERMDGLVPRGFRRRDLGRPPDAQQRSQPFGAARRFAAAGRRGRCCAAGLAEGTKDRSGRGILRARAADQHRRRDK